MSFIQRFLLGNRVDDDLQVGLFLKNDGTVWLRNPDGSETQITGGGDAKPNVVLVTGPDNYNAADGDYVICDVTSESVTVFLPDPVTGAAVTVKRVGTPAFHTFNVTVQQGGSG